jgi:GTP-binding protein HflX
MVLSAITGEGLDELLATVSEALEGARVEETLELGFSDGKKRAWLFKKGFVLEERQTESGFEIDVRWTQKDSNQYKDV